MEDEIFNDNIFKRLKTVLSKPLEIILNASFTSGIVLTDIKLANIIPIFKKSFQTCSSSYRPISLTSVFHIKLLESLCIIDEYTFLENHEILFDRQFGSRFKHHTDHPILSIVDKIQNSIEAQGYSFGVFLYIIN